LDCLISSQWPTETQARAALEDRRAAQEQQLKRAQLQAPSQGDEWAVKDQWVV